MIQEFMDKYYWKYMAMSIGLTVSAGLCGFAIGEINFVIPNLVIIKVFLTAVYTIGIIRIALANLVVVYEIKHITQIYRIKI